MLAALSVIVVATLYPLRFSPAAAARLCGFGCGDRSLPDFLANVLLYAPVGFVLRRMGWSLARIGCAGAIGSLAVETLQIWLPRTPAAQDVVANGAGALAGGLAALALHSRQRLTWYSAAVLGTAVATGWGARLAAWDAAYPVRWREEADGTRRWSGSVDSTKWCHGDGCTTLVPSRPVDPAWVAAAMRAQRFAVAVYGRSPDLEQTGPARIVTSSLNPDRRNFTVAQDRGDLVFRVRTRLAGLNGSRPELRLPNAFVDNVARPITLMAAYDRGRATLSIDGGRRALATYAFGPWSLWLLGPWRTVDPVLFRLANMLTVLLVTVPVAYLALQAAPMTIARMVWPATWTVGLLFAIPMGLGLRPGPPEVWVSALAAVVLGAWAASRLGPSPSAAAVVV